MRLSPLAILFALALPAQESGPDAVIEAVLGYHRAITAGARESARTFLSSRALPGMDADGWLRGGSSAPAVPPAAVAMSETSPPILTLIAVQRPAADHAVLTAVWGVFSSSGGFQGAPVRFELVREQGRWRILAAVQTGPASHLLPGDQPAFTLINLSRQAAEQK